MKKIFIIITVAIIIFGGYRLFNKQKSNTKITLLNNQINISADLIRTQTIIVQNLAFA